MPDLTKITGSVVLPDGSVPYEGRIHFTPVGWDCPAAGKVQPPATRSFELGPSGDLVDVYLSPSTTSLREMPYRVSVTHFNAATRAMETTALGLISVPEVAEGDSVSIRSLLSDPGVLPAAPDALAQITAKAAEVSSDRAAAQSARTAAEAAAAIAQSGTDVSVEAFSELATRLRYSGATGAQINVTAGMYVRDRSAGAIYRVLSAGATGADLDYTGAGGVRLNLVSDALTQGHAPSADIARIAYGRAARLIVKSGETVKLTINPAAGDDLQLMCAWAASMVVIADGGTFYVEIADGLHNVSTYIDVVDGGFLDIRGSADPDFIDVVSAAFSAASGAITATINVSASTPLPSRVQAGFAVGGLNIQGNGGADLLNCGMIVKARSSDTTFTADLFSDGTNLTTFTTPDNTPSLGLTPNKLMVPKCTIRAAEAGWDGAAREGFMNAERGGRIYLRDIGLSYNGVAGDNDMLFATDAGSEISLEDYCVIAGSGEMCARSFNHANIYANRSCLGGAHTGANIWQGSGGGTFTAIRTMMGSVTGDALSGSSGAEMFITASVVTGANILARTTYPDSSANITNSRLSRGNLGVAPTKGNILIDSNSSIKNCTTPISVTGSQSGIAHGDPTISGNTNPTVTEFAIQSSGGVWLPSATKSYDAGFYKVGRFSGSLNFPSIPANSYADLTVSATGAAFNDFCLVQRSGSAEPAQGIDFRAFVSAENTVTVRAYNITTSAIDPTAFTALVLVIRAT